MKKIFNWLVSDWKNIVLVLAALCLVYTSASNAITASKYKKAVIEYKLDKDTYENKIGEMYNVINTDIMTMNQLRRENKDLYDQAKALEDKVIFMSKTAMTVKLDSIFVHDTLFLEKAVDSSKVVYATNFSKTDKWYMIDGTARFNITDMQSDILFNKVSFNSDLNLDLIEDKESGTLRIIANATNPYFTINNISGGVIDPQKSQSLNNRINKKFGIVIGPSVNLVYIDKSIRPCIGVSVTAGYKLLSF